MFSIRRFCALAALVAILSTSTANAAIVFSNFGPGDTFGNTGRVLEGPAVGSIGDVNQAASFTVGPTDFMLTDVSLGIFVRDSPVVGTGPIDVLLAADAGGVPGATLRTLPINVNSTGKQVITVVDDGSQMLDANTTYWIVADAEGGFSGSWNFNSTGDIGPTAGQTEGFPWNPRPMDDRYALRVEGRAVPEPASCVFLVLGSLGMLALRQVRGA